MNDIKIEVLEETDKHYKALVDNKPTMLYKIDTAQLKRDAKQRLNRISQLVTLKDITPLLDLLEFCDSVSPRVNEYERIATEMAKELNKLYQIVAFAPLVKSSTNIFHMYIKQIDPTIYGKAQTFTRYTDILLEDLRYIKEKIDGRTDKKTTR